MAERFMVTLAILVLLVTVTFNLDVSPQRGSLSVSSGIVDGEAEGLVMEG